MLDSLKKLVPELGRSNVHMRDPGFVERAIRTMMKDAQHKLQIVADFDRTLSKYSENGQVCSTTHSVLEESKHMPEFYRAESQKLKDTYLPIEFDHSKTIEEKVPKMIEWWHKGHALLTSCHLTRDTLIPIVSDSMARLRNGCKDFFNQLHSLDIPILIFSAGIGDVIHETINQQATFFPKNMKIVANFLKFDNLGKMIGFASDEVIHTFNKNESAIHSSDYFYNIRHRENLLLMGDSIGDLRMAEGADHVECMLKIGFLNFKTHPNRSECHMLGLKTRPNRSECHMVSLKTSPNRSECHMVSLKTSPNRLKCHILGLMTSFNKAGCHILGLKTSPNRSECHTLGLKTSPNRSECHMVSLKTSPNRSECHILGLKTSPNRLECHILGLKTHPNRSECHMLGLKIRPNRSECHMVSLKTSPNRSECHTFGLKTSPNRSECHMVSLKTSPNRSECHILGLKTSPNRLECDILGLKTHPNRSECSMLGLKTRPNRSECHMVSLKTSPNRWECHILGLKTSPNRSECHMVQENFDIYLKSFDVVIVEDESLDVINGIMSAILGQPPLKD
ncbi:5'-nucleotidase [Plakobranchus ocellatus]|uniref:5'-nucleotidase n=1 Tax=Plakobranchus ocellatus TaxID=259542 RepID=A0AAV4A7S5_9GAST|nr:5'-nucleotidase [Plakobranchus ocellatus]